MQNPHNVHTKPAAATMWVKRLLFYVTGLLILAFAVSLSVKSGLGVSPVSSIPMVLSEVLNIELGNMTILVFCVYVAVEIAILRKKFRWIQLLQVVCAVLFGKFVTLTSSWIAAWGPENYIVRLLMTLASTVLVAVGVKLYLLADLIPQAADGLVQTISKAGGWKLPNVKNIFDLGSVAVAAAVSLLATGGIIGLREGTVIAALGVGRVMALLNVIDGGRLHRFIFGNEKKSEENSMKKIVCTVSASRFEKYGVVFPDDWTVTFLKAPYTDQVLIAACKKADYLFVDSVHPVSAEVLKACSHLRMVHVEGVGYNRVDIAAAKELEIPVCNNRAVNNGAVAEHTIGLILAAQRRTALCNEQIHSVGYAVCKAEYLAIGEQELSGKRVGLIGIGAIGREVARRLSCWDCEIVYYDAFRPTAEVEKQLGVSYLELDELVSTSDIISLHVPVLESTLHMLNHERFNEMKQGTIVVNTARGEIIDQNALVEALEAGKVTAALDTLDPEPAPADHPLLTLSPAAQKRVIITPHIGGTTDEAFTRMLKNAIANFERVENGEKPINVVNSVN